MKKFLMLILMPALVLSGLCSEDSKVAIVISPVSSSGAGLVISQVMQAELSQSLRIEVVEREQIDKSLREMKMDAQGLLNPVTAQKLGKIVGASYFCSSSISGTGDKTLAVVKVVDVETTLTKLAYAPLPDKDDAIAAGKSLAGQIEKLVLQFEAQKAGVKPEETKVTAKEIPADWKRPTVMVILPEMHVRQPQLIDPAGETEIVKRLLAEKFIVIDSEYVIMMKRGQTPGNVFKSLKTSTQYAEKKGVDILLYGEAFSERGASIGDFVGCRARVELKAIRVNDERILVSDSAEGGATDIAESVAGKKAIKQAANSLADTFLYDVIKAWNKGR